MTEHSAASAPKTPAPLTRVDTGLLQRQCACGNHTLAGGECAECAKKKPGLQRKLAIGASNDPLEWEADRVADQVMSAPAHSKVSGTPPRIQRFAGQANVGAETAPASVERVLASSGKPLDLGLQQDMGQRFGHDFSRVRVHTDATAGQSARDVNANAYTVGHNVVFGAGQFAPGTHEGRRLLAHELTHVVQQSGPDGILVEQSNEIQGRHPIDAVKPSIGYNPPKFKAYSPVHIARQPKPGQKNASESQDETVVEIPAEDKWKGSLVSSIVISLARNRVGFHIPQGVLLGTVDTDLAVGTYNLKPVPALRKWIFNDPGVKERLRFDVDLSESNADPWTLSYPDKLTLTVSAGSVDEPKTWGDMQDETGNLKDPLWLYEGGGGAKPPTPVADIDDYETIELVKETVTPPGAKVKDTPPHYWVRYRDKTERLLIYTELTQKMRTQLAPLFKKADEEFLLFTLETFPMWWSIVSITPLVQNPTAGARPYIPKRVPLAPTKPILAAPAGEVPAAPRIPLQRPEVGHPPEPPSPRQPQNKGLNSPAENEADPNFPGPAKTEPKPVEEAAKPTGTKGSPVFGGSGASSETVDLYHYGDLTGLESFESTASYPRLTNYETGISQSEVAQFTGTPKRQSLLYKYRIRIDRGYLNKEFGSRDRYPYTEYGTKRQVKIPVECFEKVGKLKVD